MSRVACPLCKGDTWNRQCPKCGGKGNVAAPAPDAPRSAHVCGLQGFGRGPDGIHDTCPACAAPDAPAARRDSTGETMNIDAKDLARGLYRKFRVQRTDGRSAPGERHADCDYFVLDLTHDRFTLPALRAYAEACAVEYPNLSRDLHRKCAEIEREQRWTLRVPVEGER